MKSDWIFLLLLLLFTIRVFPLCLPRPCAHLFSFCLHCSSAQLGVRGSVDGLGGRHTSAPFRFLVSPISDQINTVTHFSSSPMHRSTSKRSSKKSTGKSSSSRRRSRRAPSSSSSELSSSTSDSGSEDEEYEVGRKSRGRRSLRTMLDPGKTTTVGEKYSSSLSPSLPTSFFLV